MALSNQEKQDLFNRLKFERAVSDTNTAAIQYGYQASKRLEVAHELVEIKEQEEVAAKAQDPQYNGQPLPGNSPKPAPRAVDILGIAVIANFVSDFLSALGNLRLSVSHLDIVADVASNAVRSSLRPMMRPQPSAPRSRHHEEQERVLRERQVYEQVQREFTSKGMGNRTEVVTMTALLVHRICNHIHDSYAQTQTRGMFNLDESRVDAIVQQLEEMIHALEAQSRNSNRIR